MGVEGVIWGDKVAIKGDEWVIRRDKGVIIE